jgi:hypothetical protein
MELQETGRTSWGKPEFSHSGELREAQATRSTLEDDVLSEFYD